MQFPAGAPGAPTPQQLLAFAAANPAAVAANPNLQAQIQMMQRAMSHPGMGAGRPAAGGKPPVGGGKAAPSAAAAGAAAQAAAAAVVRAAEVAPAKKGVTGRKRRAGDLRLPDRGDLLIPDSPLFAQLQDAERRVDMLISRKKHELQEMYASFRRGPPGSAAANGSTRRKLRVYVRSEHQHQQNAADAAEPPSWVLMLSGRLMPSKKEDKSGAAAAGQQQADMEGEDAAHTHKGHLTQYIKRLEVQLDPEQYAGDAGRFVWDKSRHERDHRDSIQIRRLGSRPVSVTISLELDHQPAQWQLSPALSGALGLRGQRSLPYVMQALWGYVKAKQLYEPNDRGPITVRCDERLRELFGGAATVDLSKMADALKPHLTPPEPVKLTYTIKPDGPASAQPDCYDFDVEVPLTSEWPPYMAKAGSIREVESLDAALTGVLSRLAEHRRRRTLLLSFAQSPVDFIQGLVAAQGRELRTAAGRDGEAYELMASGDVFAERWVDDCILNYTERKQRQQAAQQQQALQEQQAALAQQAALQQQVQLQAAAAAAAQQHQAAAAAAAAAVAAQQQAAAAAAAGALGGTAGTSGLMQQQAAAGMGMPGGPAPGGPGA